MASSSAKILFLTRSPMNTVMFRPIMMELLRDLRLKIYLGGRPSQAGESLRQCLSPLCLQKNCTIPGPTISSFQARWDKFDMVISPDIYMPCRRARHRVQIFHGVSFKGKMFSEKIHRFNHVFLVGNHMRQQFIDKQLFTENDERLHNVGMPKTDAMLDGSLNRESILQDLGLDTSLPTVIYAPTWRPEASLNQEGEDIIRAVQKLKVNLIVKIHDHCRDPKSNRRDWIQYFNEQQASGIRLWESADITAALFASDLLISDASSVANEYALLDRPMLFMDVPKLLEVYKDTADLETWGRKTGQIVCGSEKLTEAIEDALANAQSHSDVRQQAARDIFYHPGQATEKAVETIYEILDLTRA